MGPLNTPGSKFKYILVAIENVFGYMELCPLIDYLTDKLKSILLEYLTLIGKSSLEVDRVSYFMSDNIKLVTKLLGCEAGLCLFFIHHFNGHCESMIQTVLSVSARQVMHKCISCFHQSRMDTTHIKTS